jgi:tRNA(Arg) A34 adenosine deaminase TadA
MSTPIKKERNWNVLEKLALAIEPASRQRMTAMLVYKNEVIALGYNKMKTHPIAKRFQKHEEAIYLHAEIDCIKNALKVVDVDFLAKCTMYVLRVKRPDHDHNAFVRGLAKPCCGCEMALDQFGIKKVYYTTDEGYASL